MDSEVAFVAITCKIEFCRNPFFSWLNVKEVTKKLIHVHLQILLLIWFKKIAFVCRGLFIGGSATFSSLHKYIHNTKLNQVFSCQTAHMKPFYILI